MPERHARLAAAICASLTLLLTLPQSASPADPPRTIARIEIIRKEIFDTSRVEDRHVYGTVVNALHVVTREEAIRKELLFQEGDELDDDLLQESARHLRALGYLGEVTIRSRVEAESLAVVSVLTQDRWSMDMLPSYRQEGGIAVQRYTLKDDNFLGGGQSISMSVTHQSDHPSPFGYDLALRERNLFGTRLSTSLHTGRSWEGSTTALSLERGYFSDRTRWAGGVSVEFGTRRILSYDEGTLAYEELKRREMQRGWLSFSVGSTSILRPVLAYTRVRSGFNDPGAADNLDLVSVSMSLLDRSFVERVRLNSGERVEDMPVGFGMGVTVGKNFRQRGIGATDYVAQLTLREAFLLSESAYLGISASARTFWGGSRSDETFLDLLLVHHARLSPYQTLVVQATASAGLGWSGIRQLLLGSSTGLRGFDEQALAGDRRITYGIEQRMFTDLKVLFFRLGAAAFLDGGTAWSGPLSPVGRRFSHAAGIGLRIENTKVQGTGLIRIDWAFNLDEGKPGQVILSSSLPFSAFLDLDCVAELWTPDPQIR